jgi:hypothetical protein
MKQIRFSLAALVGMIVLPVILLAQQATLGLKRGEHLARKGERRERAGNVLEKRGEVREKAGKVLDRTGDAVHRRGMAMDSPERCP